MLGARPSALFTTQNLITIGAIRALRDLSLHERIALIGFDDFLLADMLQPAVTVIAQEPAAIGAKACEVLFQRMDGDTSPTHTHTIPTRLIARGSGEIPPAPAAAPRGPRTATPGRVKSSGRDRRRATPPHPKDRDTR